MLCCVLKIQYLSHNYTLNIETAIKKEKIFHRVKIVFYPWFIEDPGY
jgi:hypothetical protein